MRAREQQTPGRKATRRGDGVPIAVSVWGSSAATTTPETEYSSEQEYETHRVPAESLSQPGHGAFRQRLLSQALHFTIDGYIEGMSSCKHFPSPTALEAVVAMMPTAIVLAA